jgi:predicted CXXCH cytochrome family protein
MAGQRHNAPAECKTSVVRKGWRAWRLAVFSIVVPVSIIFTAFATRPWSSAAEDAAPVRSSIFVGSASCAGCHAAESKAWGGSQHAHAMQEATETIVLGDFNDARAEHFSSKAHFFRKDGRFVVATDGKDGKPAEFDVKYTFGLDPLQQYLVEFPDGRLQALPFAWDTRPKDKGGQRWFHLYPGEAIPSSDPLHWTGSQQNWNYMCAECHSTDVHKNYDPAKNDFHTTFSEISVGCEACHGPASGHLNWANGGRVQNVAHHGFPTVAASRGPVAWLPDAKSGSPATTAPQPAGGEIETCDRCHSRRGQFSEEWRPGQPLAETHLPAFLTGDLFEDDGQMKDEVFNSPFRQSKMFAKGVICTDCHEPHGGKLKAPGSEVCSQCHLPGKFAAPNHTGHAPGPGTPDCIACHMPVKTYMVVDPRHDHSFRIPRPDLTVKIGTPNTCASCHADHDAAWAAAAVERWHGPVRRGFQTYAEAFHAARLDEPAARDQLLKVARDPSSPAVARATALLELQSRRSAAVDAEFAGGLTDPDPMVRIAALRGLQAVPLDHRFRACQASLTDRVRAVRIEAASVLAGVPVAGLSVQEREALDRASEDYIAARRFNADRAEEHSNLGGFFARQGKRAQAGEEYRAAIKLAPGLVPPRVDLADLYRAEGRESEAEALLRETIALAPNAGPPHHALGLALVRQKRYGEALEELKHATELDPAQARYAYVYGVALKSLGRAAEARHVFENALSSSPSNPDILSTLLQDALQAQDEEKALGYAERLSVLVPDNAALARLTSQLKQATKR